MMARTNPREADSPAASPAASIARAACYRRRVVVQVSDGRVNAGVEDDYHHFRVALTHDGAKVTSIQGEAVRYPWRTCPGASAELQRLVNTPIAAEAMRQPDAFDRFNQCTHQLELALVAIYRAARGSGVTFDVAITRSGAGRGRIVTMHEDGVPIENWRLSGDEILAPAEVAGSNVRRLRPWAESLTDERYQRIVVLRRCLQVSSGGDRVMIPEVASQVGHSRNACYAFQETRAQDGIFIPESVQDFSDAPDELLREFP